MIHSCVKFAGACAAACAAVACGPTASPPGGGQEAGGAFNYGESGGYPSSGAGGTAFVPGDSNGEGGGYPPTPSAGGANPGNAGGVPNDTGGSASAGGGFPFSGAGGYQQGAGGYQQTPGGSSGNGGTTQTGPGANPPASVLPTVNGACPPLVTGSINVNGTAGSIWVGTKPGPMYIYWHATGTTASEIDQGMPGATAGVATNGGIALSFNTTNNQGTDTGDAVWFTGDFDSSDQVLACGIQSGLVDTSRIYTAGYSAGGLQACAMVTLRGRYLAAAICYSGGAGIISGTPQDPSNLPATLLLHGAAGKDSFILDFNQQSQLWATSYVQAGGFAINCDDGGDHITSAFTRMGFGGRAMPFLQAHTWHQSPEPYNPLPSSWPSYCTIWTPTSQPI